MAACALALSMMGTSSSAVFAEQSTPRESNAAVSRAAALERAFWVCDYTATMRGLDATPVDVCSAVTEELKNGRFGGDFLELLAWWRQNKLAEHTKLEATLGEFGPDRNFGPRLDVIPGAATTASGV
jgi:hypothetical protein